MIALLIFYFPISQYSMCFVVRLNSTICPSPTFHRPKIVGGCILAASVVVEIPNVSLSLCLFARLKNNNTSLAE